MLASKLPRFQKTPLARDAIHIPCGTSIPVGHPQLAEICNPFSEFALVFCPTCNYHAQDYECIWEDTNEHLSIFRKRLRESVPLILRYVDSKTTFWTCLTVSAISGFAAVYFDQFWFLVPLIVAGLYYQFGNMFAGIWGMAANFGDAI